MLRSTQASPRPPLRAGGGYAAFLLVPLLLAAGCDRAAPGELWARPLAEGQALPTADLAPALRPSSREGYAGMAAFVAWGGVYLLRPGSGPEAPPRLVRSIGLPGLVVNAAQVDREGYVWVATPDTDPDGRRGGVHYAAYVVDPHAGRVHRIVRLPDAVRAVGDLVVGPEWVYLRSWRNGFSGAVGRVSRACVQDAAACGAELLADLGNVGGSSERAFLLTENALYSSSGANSRDDRRSFDKIELQGGITASSTYSGNWASDASGVYVVGYFEPGVPSLVRLDKGTLAKTAEVGVSADETLIAHEGGLLYLSGYQRTRVLVRSAETLALVREFDVSAGGRVGPVFGFVAPGVLLLNGVASLDVRTGALLLDPARDRVNLGPVPLAVRLPEGHPLAY